MPTIKVAEQAGVGTDGRPRPSEDHVVVLENAVVVLDGATALRSDTLSGGWYAGVLTKQLTDELRARPEGELPRILADAISAVAETHGLQPGASPSSTVAMVRWLGNRVDGLVLADSPIVAFGRNGCDLLADDRLVSLRRQGKLVTGADVRAQRNVGFWVAEADPLAAYQSYCRTWTDVDAVLLATDGVSAGVDDYGLFDWQRVLELVRTQGAEAVLEAVRAAERADPDGAKWRRAKRHDDQALVLIEFP
ncbi:SpoIIE family protein phosphatase [Amycolatopsis acidicola]|uniref:SpoIIE family protein phosphatase n=1 Tax=Amycolatopsis acidicola TaxID=2596893 RepID=A0A5N0VEZ3_9PSEU|nr:protein phosphatase 2C domain-containing protein [Amycolatopsis acidicola]KAA9164917.1 SpoIIE family protein phosphatase [Amycolatopsis acidicola]